MNATYTVADLIAALDLPAGARVDRRVPKKLLVENGAPTAADRRQINAGIEDLRWVAALKPGAIGVPAYRDALREYLEIAVLSAALRPDARAARLAELIHRAVPYPVFLIVSQGGALTISLAHKRWSQGEAGATVLDGGVIEAALHSGDDDGDLHAFRQALALARQPRSTLYALYQGWMDCVTALLAARITGAFAVPGSAERAAAWREGLDTHARLERDIALLRAQAAGEKQISRRVELNMEIRRLEAELAAAARQLTIEDAQ